MDADDELKLSLSAVVIATIAKKRKKRRQVRSCWVRPRICSRPHLGGYNEALLKDLRVSDCKAHQNFCRMSNDDYQQILTLVSPLIMYQDTRYRQVISADERSTCRQSRPHQLLRQQLVAHSFDMSKEIEHIQFVSTCRNDQKIVRHVAKNGNMSNGNIRHVEATFDTLLRHVADVDG